MYRGVIRVFPQAVPVANTDEPASPMEREIARAVETLKEGMNKYEESVGLSYRKSKESQTEASSWLSPAEMPVGYAVPQVFVRSVAEAIEQGVMTYCPALMNSDQRSRAILRLLNEISEYVSAPRNLYFEVFELKPKWYDFVRISVFDCVTGNIIGYADLIPPVSKVIIPNVNVPLYESPIVSAESVPHLAQVEVSLMRFEFDEKSRVVGQTVSVPVELFIKAGTVSLILDDGEIRDISYKAQLVRDELLSDNNKP
jgi:hypothetical protein